MKIADDGKMVSSRKLWLSQRIMKIRGIINYIL